MRAIKYLIIVCLPVIIFSCRKDYPEDIPNWLKERIINCKKSPQCPCGGYGCIVWTEMENANHETAFEYYYPGKGSPEWRFYYDINGNLLYGCKYGGADCYSSRDGKSTFVGSNQFTYFKREIWTGSNSNRNPWINFIHALR